MKIVPETLRKLRTEKGLSQQGLADRAKVDKKTIARLEGGKGGEARGSTVTEIAKVLDVKPQVLAEDPESEATRDEVFRKHGYLGVKLHLRGATILAYDLVRDRYGVKLWQIIDAAPLLFTLLAEMSLVERRRRLEEMDAAWKDYSRTVPEHINFAAIPADHDLGLYAEQDSIAKRDLFGCRIPENELCEMYVDNREYDEDRNPFSDFLIKLAKDLGPGNDAIDYEDFSTFGGDLPVCQLFQEYRERLSGGSPRAAYALSHGYVRLHQIPRHLRGDDEDGEKVVEERAKWLEDHVPDDDWAELWITLDLESQQTTEGDEDV